MVYNAKRILQNPDGIVATENEDGTISVSWNIVENARRYHVRVTNELGQHTYFAVLDKRTEFNRVNTRIPPEVINNNVTLEPGKYTIAVGTESEGSSYVAVGGYNDSVNYPNGQDYVTYRTVYDLTNLNLSFNLASKNLTWDSVADAQTYDVYVNEEKVGTTQECEYSLTSYFANLSHDTGAYQIRVMVKASPDNFHIDTMSSYQLYNFIQRYAAPTNVKVVYNTQNTNLATLTWQASANANAQTSYLVVINGEEQPLTTQAQMDVTELLQVGANAITVQAVEDETHFDSDAQTITDGSNVYNYTLSAIEGDITITPEAVNGDYPNISLSFAPVKNAPGYNISINDEDAVYYTATVTNGVATIALSQADVANLTPFAINQISIAPSKGTNDNILLPATSIARNVSFKNTYFIPQMDYLHWETVYMPSNIISYYALDNRAIYFRFSPVILQNEVSENNFETLVVTSYKGQLLKESNQEVLSEFEVTIPNNEVSVITVHLFEPFKASEALYFSGDLKIRLAGKIDSLVGVSRITDNTLTISKVLEQAQNISYVENENGMILSWGEVTDATSYDVLDDANNVIATISSDDLENHLSAGTVSVDLTSELYSKDVGTHTVKIVAKLGSLTSETTTQIQVEKKIKIFDYKLLQNNTKLQIALEDFPRTAVIPTNVNDTQIYATHLMLVFDSRDGAELLATSELADGYTRKLVTLTPNSSIEVSLLAYHNAQTCYAYAFNSDLTKSSISDIVEIDLTGVIKYSQPTIGFDVVAYRENPDDLEEVTSLEVSWDVEFLPFEDGMKTSNFDFDITIADDSILQSLITNNDVEFVAYDRDGNEIVGILSYNGKINIDETNENYANLKTIVAIIKNQPAGLYTAKVQAKTTSITYANDSSISQDSTVLYKTITFPHKRVVLTTASDQTTNLNTIENVNIDAQSFNLYLGTYVYNELDPTNNAIAYDTVDGIDLTTFRICVVETDSTYAYAGNSNNIISEKTYKLALNNNYGYYFVLNKSVLGIKEKITTADDPKYYVVLIKYATPNDALFNENDWYSAVELQITQCTPETIQDVLFTEYDDEFEISWGLVEGTNACYKLYITEHGQTTQLNIDGVLELTNELSPSAIDLISVTKSDIENYSETTVYDIYFKVWDSLQSEPLSYTRFLINCPYGFEYDKINDELTIKTYNNIPYDSITEISLNGYIFDISGATYDENSITFSSAKVGVIESIRQTLNEDRDVWIVVYKGSEVVFEGGASAFPVFVSAYASNIKVVVDELTWNAVEFVSAYEIYNSADNLLSSSVEITTNSVLMDALFTTGGEYNLRCKCY